MAVGVTIATAFVALFSPRAVAEDRVIFRGNYYREQSTRVLQPSIAFTVDAPDERLTLGAAYLLDAISSASIASGTSAVTGGDNVFTEIRHEANASVASRLQDWSVGGFFRYSTETDYVSRTVGASLGRDFLQRSMNFNLSYSFSFDRVFRIVNNLGNRLPWCGGSIEPDCSGSARTGRTNLLAVHYLALGYTHALHRTLLAHLSLEGAFARGPQDNPYRGEQIPNVLFETHPLRRKRLAVSGQLRWIIPRARDLVFEPRYRVTSDDWGIQTHAIDMRVHLRIVNHLRLRLRYRFYTQDEAFFWRDDMMYVESPAACTKATPDGCASADPKLDNWHSHTPGIQLTYSFDGIARYRGLHWLEGGWVQATYNHVFQTNRFGPARLGSLALSFAF